MQISPLKAILEPLTNGNMSTQLKCPRTLVYSLYNITKSVRSMYFIVGYFRNIQYISKLASIVFNMHSDQQCRMSRIGHIWGRFVPNYIAITGSTSLQDTHRSGSGSLSRTCYSCSDIRALGRVSRELQTCVWCNSNPNRGLYSLGKASFFDMRAVHLKRDHFLHFTVG